MLPSVTNGPADFAQSATSAACATSAGTVSGALLSLQRFSGPGSYRYIPTSGTTFIILALVGGGAGGGGVSTPGAGNWSVAAGGGRGGWLQKLVSANVRGASGSSGSGGAGGTRTTGTNGTATTYILVGSAATHTAQGGLAGGRNGPFAAPFIAGIPSFSATTGGDHNVDGGIGTVPFCLNANNGAGGAGGSSRYSPGARAVTNGSTSAAVAGITALGYGGGGGGVCTTGGSAAGGNGSDGLVIVWEYR